jgi:hypothetical protein
MTSRSLIAAAIASACVAAACSGGDDGSIDDPIVGVDGGTDETPDADIGGTPDAGDDPTPDAPPTKTCDGVTMDLGTGNREFTPVSEDTIVYLFKGPQGGYMVYLSVRARGINPDDAMLCYTEHVVDTDREVGKKCWNIKLTNSLGDGLYERVGVWGEVYSRYFTYPSAIRGHTLRVTATLSDSSGCAATDSWTANVSPDPPM